MNFDLSIRIAGEAGQGTQTIGNVMCRIFKAAGLHLFANQDYMSRVRGGNNYYQIRLSDQPVHGPREKCDILVAFDEASVAIHKSAVRENGIVVVDKDKFQIREPDTRVINFPMYARLGAIGAADLYINTVACGVLAALTGIPFDFAVDVLRAVFIKKGDTIIAANIKAAEAGVELAHAGFPGNRFNVPLLPDRGQLLMSGNEALALGAIKAGCKFYSAYPMTPSTDIMDTICRFAPRYSIVVEQAEDEIAAINMVIGASFAGVRAMTGTSGGGFALMGEGISLAGMTETPIVIVNGQRPAPATGLPTRTEQADLDLVIHSGHGEFARAVFAPGTVEEAFSIMPKAFEIAEKYQVPVVVLSDQHLADSVRTIDPASLSTQSAASYLLSKEESGRLEHYKRYEINETGISPRAVPSWVKVPFYVDSDEHTAEGHIAEDAATRVAMVKKRYFKKMACLERDLLPPTVVNVKDADVVLAGFGSTYGVMRELIDTVKTHKIGFVHLSQVWPFPSTAVTEALSGAKLVLTIENNAGAQLAKLMRRETGIEVNRSILKYDGRPFDIDYVKRELNVG